MNYMNYDLNKYFALFKFQSDYWKIYLNSPRGYSRNIISVQTDRVANIMRAKNKLFTEYTYCFIFQFSLKCTMFTSFSKLLIISF